jgi:hypothetical protein
MTKDCIGCGYCCTKVPCPIAYEHFGKKKLFDEHKVYTKCPALDWNGKRHNCLLAAYFFDFLYIGKGCCSTLNSWRREPLKKRY